MAVDANGFVYVADSSNHTIRKGNPALSDHPVVDVPIASIGNLRHLDVTNLTTISWSVEHRSLPCHRGGPIVGDDGAQPHHQPGCH